MKKIISLVSILTILISYYSFVQGDDRVIAVINGKEILYSKIRCNIELEELVAGRSLTEQEKKDICEEREKRSLVGIICRELTGQKIHEMGVTVNPTEKAQAMDTYFQRSGVTEEFVKEIEQQYRKMAKSLREWQANPDKSYEIYQKYLSDIMPPEQWEICKYTYKTPEKLAEMEKIIPTSLDDAKKQSDVSFEKDLLIHKLVKKLTSDIKLSEGDLQRYYNEKYKSAKEPPPYETIKETVAKELLSIRKEERLKDWWRKTIDESKIEIKDPRFKEVIEEIKVHFPTSIFEQMEEIYPTFHPTMQNNHKN